MIFTFFITAFLAIVSHELELPSMYLLKAVPTLVALAFLLMLRKENATVHSSMHSFVHSLRFFSLWSMGLVFSVLGDLSLLFPQNEVLFLAGMGFFLATHLFYSWAYIQEMRRFEPKHFLLLLPLLVYSAFFFGLLYPGLGKFLVPVCVYMSALLAMVWFSFCFVLSMHKLSKFQKAAVLNGAFLFLASDTLLGLEKFLLPLPLPHVLILGTYYLAQFFFVISLSPKFPMAYLISFKNASISSMRSAASR